MRKTPKPLKRSVRNAWADTPRLRVSVFVPREVHDRLDKRAAERGMSMTRLITEILSAA